MSSKAHRLNLHAGIIIIKDIGMTLGDAANAESADKTEAL